MDVHEMKSQRSIFSSIENQSSSQTHVSESNKTLLTGNKTISGKENTTQYKSHKKEFHFHAGEKKRNIKIHRDTTPIPKRFKTISTQTTFDENNAKSLMCSEIPTDTYWKLRAEESRKALHVALEENKELADKLERKEDQVKDLNDLIEILEEKAAHCEYLASIIEELTKNENLSNGNASKSLNTTGGNNQSPENSQDLSDGTCSHDSDKENKPELAPPPLLTSSDSSDSN